MPKRRHAQHVARADSDQHPAFHKTSLEKLPDLTHILAKLGMIEKYQAWRDAYHRWREGHPEGAHGWVETSVAEDATAAFRDRYRSWRLGKPHGASGETAKASAQPIATLRKQSKQKTWKLDHDAGDGKTDQKLEDAPAVVYDVVASASAEALLIPVDGPLVDPIPVQDFPGDALVTIRVFRFFEDQADEKRIWEQELRNVNSGSLSWLPVHLTPGMHSVRGAKYGSWFTVHYLQTQAKHFNSAYHMANEGACYPAKTFGSTGAQTNSVSGKALQTGYFWFVSPSDGSDSFGDKGWRHICRAGPFDGDAFLKCWNERGSPMDARALQAVLGVVCKQ